MDELQVFNLETRVHGRYLVRPAAGRTAAPLLVAFHGYADNASRLFEEVLEIPSVNSWHLVAVQALHPFYNPRTGEVVASWMTKLDRELAIEDNVAYVSRVLAAVRSRLAIEGPTVFVGFSQGTAMAYRAAAAAGVEADGLIALAGDVPTEIESASGSFPRVLIGRGTHDDWYDEAKMEQDLARLTRLGAAVETCVFEGGHEWTAEFRAACRDFLGGIVARC